MFTAKHSFADTKECNLKSTKIYRKLGVVRQNAKRCFWYVFFLVVVCVFSLCFALLFCKKAQKGYFPAILEVFFLFCSPNRPVFKVLPFFPFCFFFPFCLPFQNSVFSLLFVHQPLFGFFGGAILFLFFLPFPFLMFACLFQTNFPNISFLKPKLLSCWLFIYFFCCLLLWCMFLPFCFYAGFVFGMFFFCYCFVSCFAFRL